MSNELTHQSNQSILLTIDVEDWFQVENFKPYIPFSTWPSRELRVEQNTHKLLDLLDQNSVQQSALSSQRISDNGPRTRPPRLSPPVTARHERAGESDGGQATDNGPDEKVQGTFFVLGWIAERLPHLVKEIHSRGHEVASHGYRHNLCTDCSSEDLKTDLVESKKRLEDTIGAPVHGYRAPSFSINDDILKIIEQSGYLYDSSYNSFGMHARYGHLNMSQNNSTGIAIPVNQKSAIENRQFYELPISNLNFKKPFSSKLSAISSEKSKAGLFFLGAAAATSG
jgi:hypothetical protein